MTAIQRDFDGAERAFEIKRAHLPFFERAVGPLYPMLRRFTAGEFSFEDVAAVVSFGLHGPSPADNSAIHFLRQAAKFGMPAGSAVSYRPHPAVVAVLERDGHGNHAALAADILTAAVFGEKGGDDGSA